MAVVLIAEDDAHQRFLYARELTAEGYEVLLAEGGKEVLGILREKRPDVAVLDLDMCNASVAGPGMDGLDVLGDMLNMDPTLPVIIHTAYPCYQDNFASWLAEEYVVKSSDIAPLKTAIARVIKQRASQPASEARPEIESTQRGPGLARVEDSDWLLQATPTMVDEPASMTTPR